jgi:Protein of unknown function (DUF1553)/Protein of unknown function (DUF1549)
MPRTRACALLLLALTSYARAEPVRFDVEVMAVMSRAGCNQGACHGNLNGKGGFKLSLRGEDPSWDYNTLTREMLGRRTDPLRPDDSLVLRKATASIPHEGGRRFEIGSREHGILRRWIAEGTRRDRVAAEIIGLDVGDRERILIEPQDRTQLSVRAKWSDGRATDVTGLAVLEVSDLETASVDHNGAVRKIRDGETDIFVRFLNRQATVRINFVPARTAFRWSDPPELNFIDKHVFAKLKSLRMNPSALADDVMFLRRVFVDSIGTLPTAGETRQFLADPRADKRRRLIDELLKRPEFADFWALKWSDLLRNEEKVLDRKGVEVFYAWIRQAIAEGKPLNEFARELIAGRGSTYANPVANYYRALRDPLMRSEATAQVFLGVRLQCARCHNHPFERWTLDDYYQLAAFFPRVQYRVVENNRKDKFDKHEFDGEQVVWVDRTSELTHPRTAKVLKPRVLGGAESPSDEADRLNVLADWLADPANPYFARAQANRVWAHLLGRGLVEPVDDLRASNLPSHPQLLDELAADFARHRFDLRHLVRTILNSRTYQLSSVPDETNRDDLKNFSHASSRRLEAELLLDAIAQVTGAPVKFEGKPLGMRAIQLPGVQQTPRRGRTGNAERFMKTFGKPDRLLSCECERLDDVTVPQSLQMVSGELVTRLLESTDNRLGAGLKAGLSDDDIVNDFFLAALCRLPTAAERMQVRAHLARSTDRRKALEDVGWAVINSKEFLLRR